MTAIAPESVLKQLGELWTGLASPEAGASTESGVLRACAMTFLVALDASDDPQKIGETIAELMHEHPSRAIVLKPGPDGTALDARVFAQCWMPFGKRQQICCEEIEITAPSTNAAEAARLVLGLLAPDLPKVLWIRGPAWLKAAGFDDVLRLMTKVIIDTACGCGLPAISWLKQYVPLVADLAWTRSTAARQEIWRFFDDPANGEALKSVNTIIAPKTEPYVAAWLLRSLPGAKLTITEGPAGRVRLEGSGAAFEFELAPPPETEYLLLREELGITGPDRVFEAALPVAESIA